jgi:nucleotide-binding universal stress UspA family protein
VTISYVDAMVEAEEDLKKQAREFVKARTNELKEKFPMGRVTGTVYEGTVADTILDRAVGYNADLIVLGSHGRKGLNKFLLGSVAERVAAHAPCSVEIVKVKHENAAKEHRTMANTGKRAAKS